MVVIQSERGPRTFLSSGVVSRRICFCIWNLELRTQNSELRTYETNFGD
jgi:hypothetical protein